MKTPLLLVLGLLLATSTATAQSIADAALTMKIARLEGAVAPDEVVEIPLVLEYSYSVIGFSIADTTIDLKIAEAPTWIVATLSPATVVVPLHAAPPSTAGTQRAMPVESRLLISLSPDAPAGERAAIRVAAVAHPNGNIKAAYAEEATLILTAGHEACSAPVAPVAETTAAGEGLETKTLGTTPAITSGTVAVAALVGAAGGAGVAWRLRRKP